MSSRLNDRPRSLARDEACATPPESERAEVHLWGVDQQTAMMQQPHFMKNVALAGASLVLFCVLKQGGAALPHTLTGPLF